MKNPSEISLSIDGYQLQGKRWGIVGKKPVLALHGWLDNAGSFDHLATHLENIDLIALDLPGHGHSGHLAQHQHYQILALLPVFKKIAKELHWKQMNLIGHSLGSVIGTLLASQEPSLIDKLILIDGIGPISRELLENPTEPLESTMTNIRRSGKNPPKIYATLEAAILARQKAGNLSTYAAKALVLRGINLTDEGYRWRFDPRLLLPSSHPMLENEVLAMLQKIQSPTCLIEADNGLLLQHPIVQERMKQFAKLKHVILPGNHHIHLENAEAVAKVINAFLLES